MKKMPVLDTCPYCAEDLSVIQAALLLDEDAVTQHPAAEESKSEILARVRQLENALSAVDEFGYRSSHDLKEPVRKIVSFGDLLEYELGQDLSEDAKDYLDSMKRAAGRLARLIDELLEFSRAARFEPELVEIHLPSLINEIKGRYADRIRESNAYFSLGYMPAFSADRKRLKRILTEFIGNALRFHNPRRNGSMLQIWCAMADDPGQFPAEPEFMGKDLNPVEPGRAKWCRISVKDNGPGFPMTECDRVLEPYVKLNQTGNESRPGLGLAICKRIAERLGGGISAVGHLDRGATFSVMLPLQSRTS